VAAGSGAAVLVSVALIVDEGDGLAVTVEVDVGASVDVGGCGVIVGFTGEGLGTLVLSVVETPALSVVEVSVSVTVGIAVAETTACAVAWEMGVAGGLVLHPILMTLRIIKTGTRIYFLVIRFMARILLAI
jgi:hypothetical protein